MIEVFEVWVREPSHTGSHRLDASKKFSVSVRASACCSKECSTHVRCLRLRPPHDQEQEATEPRAVSVRPVVL